MVHTKIPLLFSAVLVAGFMVYVVAMAYYWVVDSGQSQVRQDTTLDMSELDLQVVWPEPDVHLEGLQTFIVTIADERVHDDVDMVVRWQVDGGVKSGTLIRSDERFITMVDVTDWDWNRHGHYQLQFSVHDTEGIELSRSNIVVRTGTLRETTSETESVPETESAPVSAPDTTTSEADAPQVLGVNGPSLIQWIPAPVDQNQRFRYHLDGLDPEMVNAFWKSEGGHENHVYTREDGPTEAVINVYGWRWRDQGPYQLTFTVVDRETSELLRQETLIMRWQGEPGASDIHIEAKDVLLADVPTTTTTPSAPVVISDDTPLSEREVTTLPTSDPLPSYSLLALDKPAVQASLAERSDLEYQTAIEYILSRPNSVWLNGDGYDSNERIRSILDQGTAENALPTFVLYNIPHRDCGSHSSGGAESAVAYRAWIDRLASVMAGERGIIIVEPDAVAQLNCTPAEARSERLPLIEYAIRTLTEASSGLYIYIDAGHPYWVGGSEMARRLSLAGVDEARGFALNVSNYVATSDNIAYGNYVSNLLGGKHYVIDTSRNGNGQASDFEWCNPPGRALGESPRMTTEREVLDGYLWIKFPGESDGQCNGGPRAGAWWPEYAVELYRNRTER